MVADNNGDGSNANLFLSFDCDFGYLQTHNFDILRDNACTLTKQKN